MGTTGNIQELRTGIAYAVQSTITTPQTAGNMVSLRQTSRTIAAPLPGFEDDAAELGKGDSWATERFATGLDVNWPWEAYLSAENAAVTVAFGLGVCVSGSVSGTTGAEQYNCRPLVQSVDGIEMPWTTLAQQIRPGTAPILDALFTGVCCEDFSFSFKSGIGRQNATVRSTWVGTGNYVLSTTTTLTLPALLPEHILNASSASRVYINGTDYVANARFMSLDFAYKNNIRLSTGYYPGSGTVAGGSPGNYNFAMRGRMRRGDPVATCSFMAEFVNGSTELTNLLSGTEGTLEFNIPGAVIGAGPCTTNLNILLGRVGMMATALSDSDGIVTCAVTCEILKNTSLVTGTALMGGVAANYNTVPIGDVLSIAVISGLLGTPGIVSTGITT